MATTTKEKVFGQLLINQIPKNLCWETPEKFIENLVSILGVGLNINENNDFVVIGHQAPGEDDKGKLWVRTATSGIFLGFYIFENGSWVKVQNRRADEVVWFYGDSRDIPDGFKLIQPGIGGIPSDDVAHIVSKYNVNIAATEASVGTVYSYFACVYVGST